MVQWRRQEKLYYISYNIQINFPISFNSEPYSIYHIPNIRYSSQTTDTVSKINFWIINDINANYYTISYLDDKYFTLALGY